MNHVRKVPVYLPCLFRVPIFMSSLFSVYIFIRTYTWPTEIGFKGFGGEGIFLLIRPTYAALLRNLRHAATSRLMLAKPKTSNPKPGPSSLNPLPWNSETLPGCC